MQPTRRIKIETFNGHEMWVGRHAYYNRWESASALELAHLAQRLDCPLREKRLREIHDELEAMRAFLVSRDFNERATVWIDDEQIRGV